MRFLVLFSLLVACSDGETADPILDSGSNIRNTADTSNPDPDVGSNSDVQVEDLAPNTDAQTSDVGGGIEDTGVIKTDMGLVDTGSVDMGNPLPINPPVGWPTGRGWDWVRNNEPFISGLSVQMPATNTQAVNKYFDDFGATSAHLWQTGAPNRVAQWLAARPAARWLAWTNFEGNSSDGGLTIGGMGANATGRIGWQVGDEPRVGANGDDWPVMVQGMQTVRAADPDALIVSNYTFQHPEIDRILAESCATEQDIVSYDRYTNDHKTYRTLSKMRKAAINCGHPYWRYIRSYVDASDPNPTKEHSATDMRWDAMSGILYGYSGHTWFVYNVLPAHGVPTVLFSGTGWDSPTTEYYNFAKQINKELLVYSRAISNLMSHDVKTVASFSVPALWPPEGAEEWSKNDGKDPFLTDVNANKDLMLGFFQDINRDHYIVAFNPEHKNGDFPTKGTSNVNATFTFDFSSDMTINTTRVQQLTKTGTVITPALNNNQFTVSIPAGDIVFFKYDTGRPFAGY